jgi:hypothetical protein
MVNGRKADLLATCDYSFSTTCKRSTRCELRMHGADHLSAQRISPPDEPSRKAVCRQLNRMSLLIDSA